MSGITSHISFRKRRRHRDSSGSSLKVIKSTLIEPGISIFFALLLVITLAMGSAAPIPADIACLASALIALLSLFLAETEQVKGELPGSLNYLISLFALLGLCTLIAFSVYLPAKPAVDFSAATSYLRSSLFFLIMFWLAQRSLRASGLHSFVSSLRWLGFLIAIIALAHWLQDNGKYFGYFSSISQAQSLRARWPFVNANHLAHFLLIPLFASLALFLQSLEELASHLLQSADQSLQQIARKLSGKIVQRKILRLSIDFLILLFISLALIASQSRSAWLATFFGALLFFLFQTISARSTRLNDQSLSITEKKYRTLFASCILSIVAIFCLTLLFSGRGSELVGERLEFGINSSLDDLRWTMYVDSLPLLKESGLRGIGAGAWRWKYSLLKSEELTNFTPHFLHSDPYQFLIELGLIACIPLLILVSIVGKNFLRVWRQADRAGQLLMNALICAALAFALACAFDFPFRLPALQAMIAALLAGLLGSSHNTSEFK